MSYPPPTLTRLSLLLPALAMNPILPARPVAEPVLDPTGTHAIVLHLEDGRLSYEVFRQDAGQRIAVLGASPLGLQAVEEDLHSGLSLEEVGPVRAIEETYERLAGKARTLTHRAREQSFHFRTRAGTLLQLTLRAMPDGVAFRYALPEKASQTSLTIEGELTGFRLAAPGHAWMLPYDHVGIWSPSYEAAWQDRIEIGATAPEGSAGWSLPALFHSGPNWVLLTEAGMDGTYFGVHLEGDPEDRLYRVRLPEEAETYGVAPREATITPPWTSPWRIVVVGDSPAPIVETNVVSDLSPPQAFEDTSWIQPGRVSWSWWSDKSSPSDFNRLVPFIDLSAELGWEFSLIDLGWESMVNGTVEELVAYARNKGVGLILWYNSGGPHNEVYAGVRDRMHLPESRRTEMAWLQRLGVKGIKVDFMQSDKQAIMQLYIDILEDAADHHLMVNFHGSTIPRGWERTYPNLMTSEGIRGAEQYWDPEFAAQAHTFHTIYPFTRNVIGSMDYTPVIFGGSPELQFHQTTNAHELALAVAFESGWQHFVDSVSAYRSQTEPVRALLAEVPAVWDETRYLDGLPGDFVVIARRHGTTWYVAALNGTEEPRPLSLSTALLSPGPYQARIFKDGWWQKDIAHEAVDGRAPGRIELELAPRGGATVVLQPASAD
jgi:alpha-glucosidase